MPAVFLALLLIGAPDAAAADTPAPNAPTTVAPLGVQAPAKPAPPKPDVRLDMPGSDDGLAANFVSIWPADAYNIGVGGHVTLSCWIDVHGLAERCDVLSETPRTAGL